MLASCYSRWNWQALVCVYVTAMPTLTRYFYLDRICMHARGMCKCDVQRNPTEKKRRQASHGQSSQCQWDFMANWAMTKITKHQKNFCEPPSISIFSWGPETPEKMCQERVLKSQKKPCLVLLPYYCTQSQLWLTDRCITSVFILVNFIMHIWL